MLREIEELVELAEAADADSRSLTEEAEAFAALLAPLLPPKSRIYPKHIGKTDTLSASLLFFKTTVTIAPVEVYWTNRAGAQRWPGLAIEGGGLGLAVFETRPEHQRAYPATDAAGKPLVRAELAHHRMLLKESGPLLAGLKQELEKEARASAEAKSAAAETAGVLAALRGGYEVRVAAAAARTSLGAALTRS